MRIFILYACVMIWKYVLAFRFQQIFYLLLITQMIKTTVKITLRLHIFIIVISLSRVCYLFAMEIYFANIHSEKIFD